MKNRNETSVNEWTRRDFMRSAAVAGGLFVPLCLDGCSKPEKSAASAGPPRTVVPNAWLRISTDNKIAFLCDRSEMGQGVYTTLPTLIAEELLVDPAAIHIEFAPPGDAYKNEFLGGQITGGSTSVRDAWQKLRMAGAEARERLVLAAARRWRTQPSLCRLEDGYIVYGSERLSYGELAEDANTIAAPKQIALKSPEHFERIGKRSPRLDTPAKVDGSMQYGIDVRLPGMLYAALAQSPVLGGTVKSFDGEKAKSVPGVRDVVQTSSGIVVLADSWWQARKGRDALSIQWNAGSAGNVSNTGITALLTKAANQTGKSVRNDGDASAAIKTAPKRIEAVYELPLLAHATLEPQNCTVEFRDDGCHVYAPTQVQQMAQNSAAKAAGLPPEKVFVHTTFLGGGFGRRLDVDFIPAAVEAAKAAGKPVKLLWTREDDTTHDKYRPPARDPITGAFDASGKLVAFKLQLVGPSITARWAPAVVEKMIDPFAIEAAQNFPYDVPNVAIDYVQQEIGIDVGYLRSVSHALNCFVIESFMDELAVASNQDPYEFRRRLLEKQPRWSMVLDVAARRANWGKAPHGHYQGIALMSGYETYLALVSEISLDKNKLRIHKINCAVDCGQMVNPSIVEAQAFGGIVFGLTAALFGQIDIEGGKVKQTNFDTYRLLRIHETPQIDIHLIESSDPPGGMGEPSVALVAPALCNAIAAATGKRLRSLPLARHGFTI